MAESRALVRALLFDLDGTLVDTADANAKAYGDALAEAGVEVDAARLRAAVAGRHWRQFLPALLGERGAEDVAERIATRKKVLYPSTFGLVRVNEGLVSLARSVRPTMRTALVTTASRANVDAIIGHFGLAHLFDVLVTGDDVERHKPEPDAWLLAANSLDVLPAECVAFEDSDIGVESARRAGITVVRVTF